MPTLEIASESRATLNAKSGTGLHWWFASGETRSSPEVGSEEVWNILPSPVRRA
jgi:hypothetical protein